MRKTLFLILIAGILSCAVFAQEAPKPPVPVLQEWEKISSFCPNDADVYFIVPDMKQLETKFYTTPLGQLMKNTTMKDVFLPLSKSYQSDLEGIEKTSGITAQAIFKSLTGPAILYVRLKDDPNQGLTTTIGVLTQMDAVKATELAGKIVQTMGDKIVTEKSGNNNVWSIKEPPLFFTVAGDQVFLSTDRKEIDTFFKIKNNKGVVKFFNSNHHNQLKKLGLNSDLYYIFGNGQNIFKNILSIDDNKLKSSGLANVKSVYGAVDFLKTGFADRLFLHTDGVPQGVLSKMGKSIIKPEICSLIPDKSPMAYFVDTKFDKNFQGTTFLNAESIMLDNIFSKYLKHLAENVPEDLSCFKNKYLAYLDTNGSSDSPEASLVEMAEIKSHDEGLKFILKHFSGLTGSENMDRNKVGKGELFSDKNEIEDLAFAQTQNYILFGNKQSLINFLNSKNSIASTNSFKKVSSIFENQNSKFKDMGICSYMSVGKYLNEALSLAIALEDEHIYQEFLNFGINLAALPDQQTLNTYLSDSILAAKTDNNGITLVFSSPVGNPLFLIPMIMFIGENEVSVDRIVKLPKNELEQQLEVLAFACKYRMLSGFEEALNQMESANKNNLDKVFDYFINKFQNGDNNDKIAAFSILSLLKNRPEKVIDFMKSEATKMSDLANNSSVWKALRAEIFFTLITDPCNFCKNEQVLNNLQKASPYMLELVSDPTLPINDKKLAFLGNIKMPGISDITVKAFAKAKQIVSDPNEPESIKEYLWEKVNDYYFEEKDEILVIKFQRDVETGEVLEVTVALPQPTQTQIKNKEQTIIIKSHHKDKIKFTAILDESGIVAELGLEPVSPTQREISSKKKTVALRDIYGREITIMFAWNNKGDLSEIVFTPPEIDNTWKIELPDK